MHFRREHSGRREIGNSNCGGSSPVAGVDSKTFDVEQPDVRQMCSVQWRTSLYGLRGIKVPGHRPPCQCTATGESLEDQGKLQLRHDKDVNDLAQAFDELQLWDLDGLPQQRTNLLDLQNTINHLVDVLQDNLYGFLNKTMGICLCATKGIKRRPTMDCNCEDSTVFCSHIQ